MNLLAWVGLDKRPEVVWSCRYGRICHACSVGPYPLLGKQPVGDILRFDGQEMGLGARLLGV